MFALACGAPLFYGGTPPNPHSPAAGHLFLFFNVIDSPPQANGWMRRNTPHNKKKRAQASVREIKLVQDVKKKYERRVRNIFVQHRAVIIPSFHLEQRLR